MNFKQIVGEFLTMLRPLVSIILIRIFGANSSKPYLISLLVDLAIVAYFQRGIRVGTQE